MTEWVLPDEVLRAAPSYTPRPAELADLELLLSGAYAPLTGFLSSTDLTAVRQRGQLADGTQWPVPVTLIVPTEITDRLDLAVPTRRALVLTDPEGAPVAAIEVTETVDHEAGWQRVSGPVRRLDNTIHGPFPALRHDPSEVRAGLPTGRILGVIADQPLHRPQLAQIAHAARTLAAHVLILVPANGSGPSGLPPQALIRAILATRDRMPAVTIAVVPLSARAHEVRDGLLRGRVAAAYGATHLLATGSLVTGGKVRSVVPRELAYDSRDGQWRPADDVPPRHRRVPMSLAEIDSLLDLGTALPEWHTPPAVARELRRARPPRRERGVVVLFTGLSGSGKSTIARGVADALVEGGDRTVTLLDGDVVRRLLSAGLGFSRGDRDLNIRRIGFVATEAARHGGVALCAPIAPYAASRAAVRTMAAEVGADFVLVHVSTALEVCERRDRKGLYAKARRGDVPAFTGVSDPYEEPTDAELTIDAGNVSVEDSVDLVRTYLTEGGWLS